MLPTPADCIAVFERIAFSELDFQEGTSTMYWVSRYRLQEEALRDMSTFWSWLRSWDDAFFGAQKQMAAQVGGPGKPAYQSSAYYYNLVGEPGLEIWLQAPDMAAFEEGRKMTHAMATGPDWQRRIAEFSKYLELVESRLVDDAPIMRR